MPRLNPLAAAAGGMMISAALAVAAHAADPLKIGVPTDLSGTYATLGEEVMRAVRFAVEEANAAGGVAGRRGLAALCDPSARRRSGRAGLGCEGLAIRIGLQRVVGEPARQR